LEIKAPPGIVVKEDPQGIAGRRRFLVSIGDNQKAAVAGDIMLRFANVPENVLVSIHALSDQTQPKGGGS